MSGGSRRLRHRIVSITTWTVLICALVLAGLMVLPTVLGYERYVIVSGSMVPTIPVGSVVYDEVVPVDDIETGDIITFVPPPEYDIDDPVTHRVAKITVAGENSSHPGARVFQTKGDANEDVDAWNMMLDGPDQARYVHHIPYVGYVYMALQVRWVQALVIVIPAIALVFYIVITLWRASGDGVREERQRQLEQTPEDHAQEEPVAGP